MTCYQSNYPVSSARLPKSVWLLSWVSFFADISSEMIYPLLPLFVVGVIGSSKTELGIMEGMAVLIVAIMTAFAGFRSDRNGRRVPWIRWGYGLPIIGKSIIALATAWPMILGGRLLDRFGKGLRSAPRDALIANAVNQELRGRAFGVHRAFDTAGALSGVLFSALLLWWLTGTPKVEMNADFDSAAGQIPDWAYRVIFGAAVLLGAVSLALTFLVRESEQADADGEAITGNVESANKPAIQAFSLRNLPRSYWSVLAILLVFSLGNSSDMFLLIRIYDFGYSPWEVVMLYALYNLVYASVSYPAGMLSDCLGRWRMIAVGWMIYVVVYVCFAILPDLLSWGVWPLVGLYGVYMAFTDGVGKALLADSVPSNLRGTALGLFYAAAGFTTLVASLVAGIAWDYCGPSAPFLIGAGFAAASLVGLAFLRRTDNVEAP